MKIPDSINVADVVHEIELDAQSERTPGERLGDSVSREAGKLSFLIAHIVVFAVWIAVNTKLLPILQPFDPYPFQFLSFVTSIEAIFLALFILMSQNRSNRQAERRAQLDLKINLLAEHESTVALVMLRELCRLHKLNVPLEADVEALLLRTEPKELLATLRENVPDL